MKPLKLTMQAFGSYGEATVVDFRDYSQGIFLITGDTGSGKTMIFDGIAYALFGETSAGQREGAMMRSHYVPEDAETYVELTFQEHGEEYTIRRNPAYQRMGKRKGSDGTYKQVGVGARASLFLPDGTEYAGNIRETNQRIRQLIGVDREQFSQIAMIAQGEYMKLLLASSKERKAIFSRIFQTGIYEKIQQRLKEKYSELHNLLEDNRKLAEHEQSGVILREDCSFKEKWEDIAQYRETGAEQIREVLGQIVDEDKAQERKYLGQCEVYQKRIAEISQKLQQSNEINELFAKKEKIDKKLDELDSRSSLRKEMHKILELGEKAGRIDPVRLGAKEAADACQASVKHLEELNQAIEKNQQHKEEIEERLNQVKNQYEAEMPKVEQELVRLEDSMAGYEQLEQKSAEHHCVMASLIGKILEEENDYSRIRNELSKEQGNLKKRQDEYVKANQIYDNRYIQFLEAQAGILAEDLMEGKPCPVCGSVHHPNLASLPKEEISQQIVEDAKKQRDLAEGQRTEAANRCIRLEEACSGKKEIIQQIQENWPEKQRKQWDSYQTQKTEQSLGQLQLAQGNLLTELDQIKKNLPFETKVEAQNRLNQRKARKKQLQNSLDEILAQAQQLKSDEAKLHGIQKAEVENAEKQKELFETKNKEYLQMIQEQGFVSEQAYLDARCSQEELASRKNELEQEEQMLLKVQTLRTQYEEFLKDKHSVDTTSWKEELEKLQADYKAEKFAADRLTGIRTANERIYTNLVRLGEKKGELESEYGVIRKLYQTANGKLTGTVGLDFQTFIQRQYFEQMIHGANRRLKYMSDGQFILQCRSLDALGKQGEVGLDLDIYSVMTGKTRDVKTLSGGESFMAALAMALGMADIIQNQVGSIHIETMFIDEGFGSLDEMARMRAVQILQDLTGGKRSIGIISHVTELKEQIDKKIQVYKDEKGSHVRAVK